MKYAIEVFLKNLPDKLGELGTIIVITIEVIINKLL
jgi:hypothetical protein